MHLDHEPFGVLPDGRAVDRFVLAHGATRAAVITFGARLQSLRVPDRRGDTGEVTLGCDDLDGYLADTGAYLGAVVGRYAGRISGARFPLDGTEHRLPANHGTSCLHGGPGAFDRRLWTPTEATDEGLTLTLHSPDDDNGFPGHLVARATYRLDDGGLHLTFNAETDRPTVVNLTSHVYWNLAGAGTIDDHLLRVAAGRHLPVDDRLVPDGPPQPVTGTELDLRTPRLIPSDVDHDLLLDEPAGEAPQAILRDPASGRTLHLHTDRPCVHVYDGSLLDGSTTGHGGRLLGPRAGVALECQHPSDAPNRRDLPSTTLRPGRRFASTTTWRFTAG